MFFPHRSRPLAKSLARIGVAVALATAVATSALAGCGSTRLQGFADAGAPGSSGSSGGGVSSTSSGTSGSGGTSSGGTLLPDGGDDAATCSGGTTGTISGTVYDPAMKNPLYNVAVYVPANTVQPLPRGVPTGAAACSCAALYESHAVAVTATDVNGKFTLSGVPAGTHELVLQIGKWRRVVHGVDVVPCTDNAQPDKSLALPGTVPAGDTDDNMPDIAVSTGFADTLECLMLRMGVPASEYVAGSSMAGHIHIFAGGEPGGMSGNHCIGWPQTPAFPGAPPSYTNLWANQAQLMPYDITLLSCEACETWQANPPALEAYLNAGGRVFASHYHYTWFGGPIQSGKWYAQLDAGFAYAPPPDWGLNLGTWTQDLNGSENLIGGTIVTTLNGSNPPTPFSKGTTLQTWLQNQGALGQNGVTSGQLSIYTPKYNVTVAPANTPSQPWIVAADKSTHPGATMYFSFDTPVNAPPAPDGGPPNYCGRAVFSDLHVSGDPATMDTPPAPGGCSTNDLSPQEKALEFMLFDLSSCVISDQMPPPGPPQ
jgi:hypothetical protein